MEGGRDVEHHGALDAAPLRDRDRPLHRRPVARQHHLAAAIVVGDVADLGPGRLGGDLGGDLGGLRRLGPDQGRHGAGARCHRPLHCLAADAQELGRVGDRDGAGGGQGRILAERVAGDALHAPREIEAALGLEHPEHREARGHQGRLGIRRQGQLLARPLEHQPRQVLAERGIDLLEHRAGLRVGLGEGTAHADDLTALAGENE
ncbi:hypothetical protein AEGHOMDF_4018 [Methylobacterium soli]|nr:hypothetical protein AEGHOMDF_4018 [Methylobacterium soli]